MERTSTLGKLLSTAWPVVLQHFDRPVLIMDAERALCYVNHRARSLLGIDIDEAIGCRCRLTSRGVDCGTSCPLTYALEEDLDVVEGFATVYHTRDGHPVAVEVTVVPLRDENGEFAGAVEILRPAEADPGFFLSGRSQTIQGLRQRIIDLARSSHHLILVGEPPACEDVARAVHRFSGLADGLFRRWYRGWEQVMPWPPGTLFVVGEGVPEALDATPPAGWRVVVGVSSIHEVGESVLPAQVVELPEVSSLREDLPFLLTAWIRVQAPRVEIDQNALQRLCRLAADRGLEGVERVLNSALAVARDRLGEEHLPIDSHGAVLLDELLQAPNPMAALEVLLLREVLARCGWRMQEAADRLGISRVTLWRKLREHGVERPDAGVNGQSSGSNVNR